MDVQYHVSWLTEPDNLQFLRQCDIFFPNEREAEWISSVAEPRHMLQVLREKGLTGVGLKLGGRGGALLWNRDVFMVDPFPVDTVDTTGAGDCFNAGIIYARLRDYTPQRCLSIANICGALSTRALGGVIGFPSVSELADSEAHQGRKER